MRSLLCLLVLALVFIQCKQAPDNEEFRVTTSRVPDTWIKNRVRLAKERLENTEAGRLVWEAMQAHGGLAQWYGNGPLSFQFNYRPLGEGTQRNTYQVIDTWRNHARHFKVGDSTAQYGWNGKVAWKISKDSTVFPYNVRFWALTPYYFSALPFVLDGNGVKLEKLPAKPFKDIIYDAVKVTFEPGTGDAPEDYYILYFHPDSHKLEVIRYIVSYPAYFEDGEHMPEKFMTLHGEQEAGGIVFPEGYKTYWLTNEEQPGEYITEITLSTIAFQPAIEASYFDIPKGAEIIDSL